MIAWPTINGKLIGTVLRSSSWNAKPGVIADQTLSGKLKTRASHIKIPNPFTIIMHMTLEEYRAFDAWWENIDRNGVYPFAYPKINDTTGALVEYQFMPDSDIGIKNTTTLHVEISMAWQEAA
jgi:hypothetical protein